MPRHNNENLINAYLELVNIPKTLIVFIDRLPW